MLTNLIKIKKNDILCLICVKGNSKGLKNKNIKKINGKTLLEIGFEKAKKNEINYFCLSTESNKIRRLSKKIGLSSFFTRSISLTRSNVAKLEVWKDALIKSEIFYKKTFKYILDIEITNPLTTHRDLRKFITYYFKNEKSNVDGCFCVNESKKNPHFTILKKTSNGFKVFSDLKKRKIFSRQKAPKTYDHIGAFYILKRDYLLNATTLFDGNLLGYNIEYEKTFDIDTKKDFDLVSRIILSKKNRKFI